MALQVNPGGDPEKKDSGVLDVLKELWGGKQNSDDSSVSNLVQSVKNSASMYSVNKSDITRELFNSTPSDIDRAFGANISETETNSNKDKKIDQKKTDKQREHSESDAVGREKKLQEEKKEVEKHTEKRLREQSIDKKTRDVKQDDQRATEKKHDSVTKESRALDKTAIEASSKTKVDDKRLQDKRLSDKAADTKAKNDKKTSDEAKAKKSQDVSEVPTAASGGAVTGSRSQLSALQSDLNRLKDRQEQLAKSLQQVYQTTGIVDAFRSMVLSSSISDFPRIEMQPQPKDQPIKKPQAPVQKEPDPVVASKPKPPVSPTQNLGAGSVPSVRKLAASANALPIERSPKPMPKQQPQQPVVRPQQDAKPQRSPAVSRQDRPSDVVTNDPLPSARPNEAQRPTATAPRVDVPDTSPKLKPTPVDPPADGATADADIKKSDTDIAIESPPTVVSDTVQTDALDPITTDQNQARLVIAQNIQIDEKTRQIYRELSQVQQQIEEKQTQILKIQG